MSTRYHDAMAFRSGNGAAWLDLLSTLSGRYQGERVDAVDNLDAVRSWLREFGLEPAGAVTSNDVALVIETRELLHRLAVAAVRGARPSAGDVRRLNAVLDLDAGPFPLRNAMAPL